MSTALAANGRSARRRLDAVLRLCAALFCLFGFILAVEPAGAAGRRVALVVGNAAYETLPKLDNTINDSRAVSDALTKAGFEVYYGANLKRIDFEELIKRYYRGADGAEIALVYYSGHGVQVAGANYVLPVDAKLTSAYDIELQTLNIDDVFQYLNAHTSAQLIFLDACRNNPFHTQKFWIADKLATVESDQGLAKATYSMGSLIAFSTTPGKVAFDGAGGLSPYTRAFVSHVPIPNQEIREALTQVRREVIEVTGGKQIPWENSSLIDDIYLVRAPAAPSVAPMLRVDVSADAATPLNLPPPLAQTNSELVVRIDRLPEQGRILLDGKPLDSAGTLSVADLDRLSFDPAGAPRGVIGLMSYSVSDPWKQTARGIVAIAVGASGAGAAQPAQTQLARDKNLDGARAYLKTLDGAAAEPTIGVGAVRLGLAVPLDPQFAASEQAEVASAPETGALRVGDRVLTPGSRLSLIDMSKLAFEPKVGSEGREEKAVVALVSAPDQTATLNITPALDACDVEAAAPLDLQGVAAGKLPNEIDAAKAIDACKRATERFSDVARFQYQLGRAQMAAALPDDARISFNGAAARKHLRAMEEQGALEQLGVFGAANPAKADGYYATCAKGGDAYCLYAYGKALFYGHGVAKQASQGLALMIRAAELGHTFAMNELGGIFIAGRDAPKDVERGIRYWEAGAARADIYSYNNLGLVYLRGNGRPADPASALDYFTKAADGGHPFAPTNLGRMYRDGTGVPADISAAGKWLETAGQRGDYWGALDRANLYHDDNGKPRDPVETATWLALACALNVDRGNADPAKQAAHQLAALPAADKQRALSEVEAKLGAEAGKAQTGKLDDRLIALSGQLWRRGKPRYDLF